MATSHTFITIQFITVFKLRFFEYIHFFKINQHETIFYCGSDQFNRAAAE